MATSPPETGAAALAMGDEVRMPPTEYPYRTYIQRRRAWATALVAGMGALYFMARQPIAWTWLDIAMLAIVAVYAVRLIGNLAALTQPRPKLVISDEGVRDPALGGVLIPWPAIKEIKVGRSRGLWQLFLVADAERLARDPNRLSLRLANRARGARAGRKGAPLALAMTPSAALDVALDELLQDIRTRPCTAIITMDGTPGENPPSAGRP